MPAMCKQGTESRFTDLFVTRRMDGSVKAWLQAH